MENKNIKLERKKEKDTFLTKIKKLFSKKGTRYALTIALIIPFLVAMCVFGVFAYKEAKNVIALLAGETEVNEDHIIKSYNYVLRDNATDIQFEYFTELKNAIEAEDSIAEDIDIAGLVVKNYVTDFYTWSNKQGQYDVGGLYYVYTPQKSDIYLQARDGFYKYISTYISQYGVENLLEVESATITSNIGQDYEYTSSDGETFSDVLLVSCSWTYKQNSIFSTYSYPTKCNFLVVKREGRMEIVEASEGTINVQQEESNED